MSLEKAGALTWDSEGTRPAIDRAVSVKKRFFIPGRKGRPTKT